mgnify:CR=1 FL=1
MKKIVLFVMATVVALSLFSCEKETTKDTTAGTDTVAVTTEDTTEDTTEVTDEVTEVEATETVETAEVTE